MNPKQPGSRPGSRLRHLAGAVLVVTLGRDGTAAPAQTSASRPSYESHRFNEDWSPLRDPALRTDPFDPLKWVPLNGDGSWYLTLGGELRARYESSRDPIFGLGSPRRNDYTLLRSFLFADLHLGPHLRGFVELASGFAPGWGAASRRRRRRTSSTCCRASASSSFRWRAANSCSAPAGRR